MIDPSYNIAAVERDTGLSKDVLRVWERRYGFPAPARDEHGERIYPGTQVQRLRLIKRLIDAGHRPGKLLATSSEDLNALLPRRAEPPGAGPASGAAQELDSLMALLKQHDSAGYQEAMQRQLARQGLGRFVRDTVAPLTRQIGEAWENGSFAVFEEHLFTELTKRLLRQTIASLPAGKQSPRIVLTSVPDEPHVLGLLMAEALFALEGAECVPLGAQMPLAEIGRAAVAHQADIVALSFSVAFPQRQIPGLLQQLRMVLPAEVALWAGGGGVRRLPDIAGVELLDSLERSLLALAIWRRDRM